MEKILVSDKIKRLVEDTEKGLKADFEKIDEISFFNQSKVLESFIKNKVALANFSQTTGYGYGDLGRDTLNALYADVFGAEDAVVSPHIQSGTHAIWLALSGVLRPGNTLLSICGSPYDTLKDVISGSGNGSLKDFKIGYEEVPLKSGSFDKEKIKEKLLSLKPEMVFIQRSRGYVARNPFSVEEIGDICGFVKSVLKDTVIFCDNCYGEFTEIMEPVQAGADLIAGSLIKNPGGGIAPCGGYIAGRKDLVRLVSYRLTLPSVGCEIGSNFGGYQYFYQGFFMAPHVTAQSLKGALLMGEVMKTLGYRLIPENTGACYDIIRAIQFKTADELIMFCQTVQKISPVDSFAVPYPWDMPGYNDKVIMAAGCFVQGASIELSCDAPIRAPYIAYCQGGITYEHVKLAAMYCAQNLCGMKS